MNYAAVAVGESYTICGYKLKPLQLGHIVMLETVNCDPVTTPHQLAMAILICSKDWESAMDLFHSRSLDLRLWWRTRKIISKGFEEKAELWRKYLTANTAKPSVVNKNEGSGDSGTPFVQHLRTVLLTRLNYSPETVLRTPFLQAQWDYLSYWEMEGQAEIYDPEFLDDIRKQHAESADGIEAEHRKRMGENGV